MRGEIAAIWRANGVEIVYPEEGSISCTTPTAQTVGFLLVEQPGDVPGRLVARLSSRALGATAVIGGSPTNLVLAFAGRAFTVASRIPGCTTRQLSCVSLLLGRVAAHELGHVLLRSTAHEPVGLMRPTFERDDLGTESIERYLLSETQRARVRSRLGAGIRPGA